MIRRLILGFAIFAALFFVAMIPFYPWLALGLLFLSHLLLLYPTLVKLPVVGTSSDAL